jgi:hypothetical protein
MMFVSVPHLRMPPRVHFNTTIDLGLLLWHELKVRPLMRKGIMSKGANHMDKKKSSHRASRPQ